jgi:D-alanyl-D-alanine endopeptidase (penicillin-binding protein 7)
MMKAVLTRFVPYLLVLLALVSPSHNIYFEFEKTSATAGTVEASVRPQSGVHYDCENALKTNFKCRVESAVLINYDKSKVIYAKNPENVRPIASISKLMTAMVLIDSRIDLSQTETITKEDALNSSKSKLRVGTKMTLMDLLHASLMQSDNRATRALARAVVGSNAEFAKLMNLKSRDLGLVNTHFNEPTGLDSGNVSTALEVAQLMHNAYEYKLIASITAKKTYGCNLLNKRKGIRTLSLHNTNALITSPYKVLAGKTGFINAAAHCLTTLVQNGPSGDRMLLVVLGAPSSQTRFREARKLAKFGFEHAL